MTSSKARSLLFAVTLASGVVPARAGFFTFDALNPGDPANLASAGGIHFEPAVLAPDLDGFGDPIPGTDKWRVDYSAPPVTVSDPSIYGGGPAPSPALALDAFLQPVLMVFPGAADLSNLGFILDGDSFGGVLDVLFLDANGQVLLSLPVDETQPYFNFNSGPVSGVAEVLLPAGALYDNIAVPEAGTSAALVAFGVLGGLTWWRRQYVARS
jgi:hypothetical protein